MPIYEYICRRCGLRNSFLVFPWENEELLCKRCGSADLERIISRFARLRSEEERIERTVDDAIRSVDVNNPESIKNWMRKTLREYQDELGSDVDVEEAVEALGEELKGEREDKVLEGESEESSVSSGSETD